MYFLDSIYPAWVLNSLTADRVKDQEKNCTDGKVLFVCFCQLELLNLNENQPIKLQLVDHC